MSSVKLLIVERLAELAFVALILYGMYSAFGEQFPILTQKQKILIVWVIGTVWVRPGFPEKSAK